MAFPVTEKRQATLSTTFLCLFSWFPLCCCCCFVSFCRTSIRACHKNIRFCFCFINLIYYVQEISTLTFIYCVFFLFLFHVKVLLSCQMLCVYILLVTMCLCLFVFCLFVKLQKDVNNEPPGFGFRCQPEPKQRFTLELKAESKQARPYRLI